MSRQLIKVKDHKNLARDKQSGAILNTNESALLEARARRAEAIAKNKKLESQEQRINTLEDELKQIKEAVKYLFESQKAE